MPDLISFKILWLLLLYLIFIVCAIVQLFYIWYFFAKLAFYKSKSSLNDINPISVIICAKNELANLKRNLVLVLEQDYPNFEVIVVDDASDDGTGDYLQDLGLKYKHLKIVSIRQDLNFFRGKKFPLSIGIKSSANDLVLLTDADCKPASKVWIRKIAANFNFDNQIVLGYGAYSPQQGLLDRLVRFDTVQIAMQYLSFALSGNPYMGVGRNLAYRKSLFFDSKGFTSHYKVSSGDDDLFINQCARKQNTTIEISPLAFTVSGPSSSFSDWIRQKRRHLSTGRLYKPRNKILLGTQMASLGFFYVSFVALLICQASLVVVLSLFAVRLTSYLLMVKKCTRKLNEKKLLVLSPLYEVLLLGMNLLLSFSNLFVKNNKWK